MPRGAKKTWREEEVGELTPKMNPKGDELWEGARWREYTMSGGWKWELARCGMESEFFLSPEQWKGTNEVGAMGLQGCVDDSGFSAEDNKVGGIKREIEIIFIL